MAEFMLADLIWAAVIGFLLGGLVVCFVIEFFC